MSGKTNQTDAVIWKDEGEFGPVWVRRNGKMENYVDSDQTSPISGTPVPRWFTAKQAETIAEKEGLPFEAV